MSYAISMYLDDNNDVVVNSDNAPHDAFYVRVISPPGPKVGKIWTRTVEIQNESKRIVWSVLYDSWEMIKSEYKLISDCPDKIKIVNKSKARQTLMRLRNFASAVAEVRDCRKMDDRDIYDCVVVAFSYFQR